MPTRKSTRPANTPAAVMRIAFMKVPWENVSLRYIGAAFKQNEDPALMCADHISAEAAGGRGPAGV